MWIAEVAEDELVGGRSGEIVRPEIDGANPVSFGFEAFDEVAADEATAAIDKRMSLGSPPGRLVSNMPRTRKSHCGEVLSGRHRKRYQRNLLDVEGSFDAIVEALGGTALELDRQRLCR